MADESFSGQIQVKDILLQLEVENPQPKTLPMISLLLKKKSFLFVHSLVGQKNTELMSTLKSYVSSGNPNAIKELDKAQECLSQIKKY